MITVSSLPSPIGEINVRRMLQTGATIYEQGDCCQSEADEQGVSLSSYIHALFSLIWQKRSARVLMIGCGGGTLATLLVRAGVQVTVVDNNPNSFFLAHNYFQMPAQVNCVVADGADYLDVSGELYDAVVLDAYNGSRIPGHLRSPRFLKLVKRRLDRSEGIFLANVFLHHDFDLTADRMIHTASSIWHEVALLDGRGHSGRNAIALAGAINNLELPTLLIPPSSQTISIQFELSLLKFREGRLGGAFAAVERFQRLAAAQDLGDPQLKPGGTR
jgi:SAM-dependent methyltransferase